MTKSELTADITALEEAKAVFEQCHYMIQSILSEDMLKKQHGDVEKWINIEGHELMRRLLQSHLDERARKEELLDEVTGKDKVVRDQVKEGCERKIISLFGPVVAKRRGYCHYGAQFLYPLDAKLNLSLDSFSDGIGRRVAEEVVDSSFDQAVATIARTTGGKVPKRQAEELTVKIAQDFEAFYESQACGTEETNDLLVLSFDGKGIVMRPDSLREATKKAAENQKHKMKTRLSAGEKANRKRMATVASVYTVERHMRTAEDIMQPTELAKARAKPKASNKRVWASAERDMATVVEEGFLEALRRDPEKQRQWVGLVDGNKQQLKLL